MSICGEMNHKLRVRALALEVTVSIFCILLPFNGRVADAASNITTIHRSGYCSLFDYCGMNEKGNVPCPSNRPAEEISDSLALKIAQYCPYLWHEISPGKRACCTEETVTNTHNAMSQAFQFIRGCPACLNNFAYLWCTISCSPDQSLFTDVIEIAVDPDTNLTAVKTVNFYFTEEFKKTLFDSCKDVKYDLTNLPFMIFFGAPETPDDFLRVLGTSFEDYGEAPYTLQFRPENKTLPDMVAHDSDIPGCRSSGFECSCADCSSSDYCKIVPVDKDDGDSKCGPLRCYELGILFVGLLALALVSWIIWFGPFERSMQDIGVLDDASEHSYDALGEGNEYNAVIWQGETLHYTMIERCLQRLFQGLGVFIAGNPLLTITVSLSIVGILSLGNINYHLESSPQGLWTPKGSRSEKEQDRYEDSFGPFYRVENLIIRTTPASPSYDISSTGLPRIVSKIGIDLMFDVQDIVDSIKAQVKDDDGETRSVKLTDVCYKPLGVCVIESVLQYWQMDRDNWDRLFDPSDPDPGSWAVVMADDCFQHWTTRCHSTFQSPLEPKIVLGGYPLDDTFESYVNDTTAFVVSYLLSSDKKNEKAALAWEEAFIDVAKEKITKTVEKAGFAVSFRAERSTEDEIDRETYMDALTVCLSYLVMFVYIGFSLTFLTKTHEASSNNWFVRSHVVLALQGICIVVLSVIGALGLLSLLSIKVSLIVLEVIPFLVLAVGVDNMFILANALRSLDPSRPISLRLGSALAEVGPSITCAAMAEGLAFGLAALADVPAVRTFSLCACFAILLDFFLQCTLFAALLVLDASRRESGRVDCIPCLQLNRNLPTEETQYVVAESGTPSQQSEVEPPENILQQAINKLYVPFLLSPSLKIVRYSILCLTVGGFVASLLLAGRLERGMEEQVAFPTDSYLQDYFTEGLPLMRVGAPVMFVVNDLKISARVDEGKKICGIAGCQSNSLVSQIDVAATDHAYHLASPTNSWIDDFLLWLNTPTCCRTRGDSTELCPYEDYDDACIPCSLFQFDTHNEYQLFLPGFMNSTPSEICPRGGRGTYEDYIQHQVDDSSIIIGLDKQVVQASSFRTYYYPLITQTDYIEALEDSIKFADDLSNTLGLDIYAYSVFHVFFQQYLSIVPMAVVLICIATSAVFVVCWILLSSLRTALLVLICVVMTVVDILGASYISDVKLNGVSVVNITMSVGIAVEFCVHIAHAFVILPGSRLGRVSSALRGVGLSVISGIAITKLVGVSVLAFATTKLFKIYYFRMYMALVILGAWHGLVVLPILLALFGPKSPVIKARTTITTTTATSAANVDIGKEVSAPLVPSTS